MKIWTKSRILAVGIGLLAGCGPPAAQSGDTLDDGRVHVEVFEPAASHAYLVTLAGGRALWVDTGIEPDGAQLRQRMEAAGLEEADLVAILLTHGHGDHINGAAAFPGVPVYALATEAPLVAGEVAPERPFPSGEPAPTGVQVTEPLEGATTLRLAETDIEVFPIPGHTDGSVAYLIRGVLYLGDAATRTGAGELEGATWIFSKDVDQSRASLRALAETLAGRDDIHTLAFGHSGPLEEGMPALRRFVGLED